VKYDTAHPSNKELKLENTEIFLDELKETVALEVEMEDDIVFAEIHEMQLSIHDRYSRDYPMRSSFNITENEYRRFTQDFSLMLVSQKKYLNEVVLRNGIKFPYEVEQFYTTVQFRDGAMYFINVVEEEYATYKEQYPHREANDKKWYSIMKE
jgi:hypothetical protein